MRTSYSVKMLCKCQWRAENWRSVTAQLVACMPSNLLLLGLGMATSFGTVALPNLLKNNEGLSLDETQSSWFGSISFLTQPVGALLTGPIVDYFGRRTANCIVNIPHLIAWILMYFSWNLPSLFIANILLGIGSGIMEAPINSYVAEISHPSIRGSLCTLSQTFAYIGSFFMYFLGTVVDWRQAALISLAVPVSTLIFALLAPDTPVWLISKGREKDALKALCYLRGWTSSKNVEEEFKELIRYNERLQQCVICYKTGVSSSSECDHSRMNIFNRSLLKFRYVMLSKETIRPLTFIILYFTFYNMSGLASVRPNLVNVSQAFGMVGDGKNIVVIVGIITFLMAFLVIGLIKILGKRKLALSAMIGTVLSATSLSVYAKLNLDEAVFSYDPQTFPKDKSYIPLTLLYILTFFSGLALPWILMAEVFPFRSRASSQGIGAATSYVITFIASKTFIDLELNIHLWGAFAVYAGFGLIGTIYMYFFLPETEGKSLQEIESFYSGKFHTFADDPFINFIRRFKR